MRPAPRADGLFMDNQIGKTATPSLTGWRKLFVTVGADGALIYRKERSAGRRLDV
jgi:hypothetical protein